MIIREKYLNDIRPYYDTNLIKVIVGVRRSGKSILIKQIVEEIKLKSINIIYLDFDDFKNNYLNNSQKLYDFILEKISKNSEKFYLFFDEIQKIDEWEKVVNSLKSTENVSIFITGSNSKLLSGELTTLLSGRYISFKIQPFSFIEASMYCKELNKNLKIIDYIKWGSFPQIFELGSEKEYQTYLTNLYESIVIKDIINRNPRCDISLLERITNYILSASAKVISSNSIVKYLKSQNINKSQATIYKYISYVKNGYIIDECKKFNHKLKRYLNFYEKYYSIDVGLVTLISKNTKIDIGYNLETIIYNELIYRGYDVFTYDINNKEIDFFVSKNTKKYYIQVAYTVIEEKTFNREIEPFRHVDNLYQKILITNDDFDFSIGTIKHIKLIDFLNCNDIEELL